MIKEIHYKNFKALRDTTLPLGRFTLIVGANGTGKTTALNSFNMLKKPQSISWNNIVSTGANQNTIVTISYLHGEIKWSEEWDSKGYVDENDEEIKDYIRIIKEDTNKTISTFRKFNFDYVEIAEPVKISKNLRIEESGQNFAGVLDQLQDDEPETFDELNRELNNWFPEFDRILFETPHDGMKAFMLRTKIGKHKIKAKDLSDGTLVALAYLTLAYLPNPPKIVAFEEPEKGIHPRLLENIQEAMYRLAYPESYGEKREPVQVIATTHSPYLLDLYKEHPEEIVIASKDEKGVHFERLIDKPHYEEVIQDAPLGDIWYSGILGGVPIQP